VWEEDAWDIWEENAWDVWEWDAIEFTENPIIILEWRSQRSILSVKSWEIHFIDFLEYINIIYWLEIQIMYVWW